MSVAKQQLKVKRLIESNDRRVVHFIFNPMQPIPISPFARKFNLLMDGLLDQQEAEDAEKFDSYIDRIGDDALEEGETHPIKYETSPFFELGLTNIRNISFAVADNPFAKAEVPKYYPEVIVLGPTGEVVAKINPECNHHDLFPDLNFVEGFRDENLRINDDRKVQMDLDNFKDPVYMILLLVRSYDTRKEKVTEGAFDQAWFRLQNEQTNQTISYSKIKKLEEPEGYEEGALPEADDEV